ncbi:MAG TPA: hypothetical protein VGF30_15775, partial [Bacteroidia bacterium]
SVSHIFDLVKSLTPSEKGYVKKYFNSNSKKQSNFIELIDYVDGFSSAIELHAAASDTSGKLLILAEDFFAALLTALEKYHASTKKDVRRMLNNIEILTEKNLHAQAEKIISKAKNLSEKIKDYHLYAEISDWEVALLGQKPPTEKQLKEFQTIFEKLVENMEKDELYKVNA